MLFEEVIFMSIVYKCSHCGHVIGTLKQEMLYTSELGWDVLTKEEKQDMIQHQSNGDVHIKTICETCEELLDHHPEYHELDSFIQ